jgi:ABC-type uncharacterized transport system permease subunit
MAAITEGQAAHPHVVDPALVRRNRALGILLLVLAAVIAGVFGLDAHGDARFNISAARAAVPLPPLIVPSAIYIYVVAALIAFLGVRLLMRTNSKFGNLMLGIGLALFVTAFLTWATDEKSLSLIGLLQSAVVRAVPIAFAGLAGVLCERVGVTNIGIEGMMLSGAFTGAVAGSVFGGEIGLVAATLVGGGMGLVLALLTVTYRLDHIIAGVVINMLALGITSYASSQILTVHRELNDAPIFRAIEIPLLSHIPILGPMLFSHNLFVYAAVIMILSATYYLFHTRMGLRARSVGEHPRAADTLGINVFSVRYINVMVGGMVAGFGGAYFTLGAVGQFEENMTAGRGYIGLAAMIFGRWHPLGVLAAALIFGFFDTLQQKLVILSTPVPSEFLAMAPYLVTIIVVAGLVGRARAPAADGTNYVKA